MYLIPPEETLIPSDESLISLGNLIPSCEVICSLDDENISPQASRWTSQAELLSTPQTRLRTKSFRPDFGRASYE